jgi:AbrB family looped-hinge helix DNA binding protein
MSTKGQVVIPADIRRALGLRRRARFLVAARDGAIILTPVAEAGWRELEGALRSGRSLTVEIEAERRREAARRR